MTSVIQVDPWTVMIVCVAIALLSAGWGALLMYCYGLVPWRHRARDAEHLLDVEQRDRYHG
jgi:hypothetical protein